VGWLVPESLYSHPWYIFIFTSAVACFEPFHFYVCLILLLLSTNENPLHLDLHAAEKADWFFKPQGDMWLNSNLVMKGWTYGSTGEEPAMKGWDVIILSCGKVKQLYAMIEGIHTHPQAI
jgi:hypothetical protein